MFKNLKKVLLALGVIMAFGLSVSMGFGETGTGVDGKQVVKVGNKICPVTDEKIDKNSEVTYEYKGKVYSFCCRACIIEFKKDPEKFIEKIKKTDEGNSENAAQ